MKLSLLVLAAVAGVADPGSVLFAAVAFPTSGPTVTLPPVMVEAEVRTRPWLYAEMPGLVVLSRCSESTTLEFMRGDFRARELLRNIFPERLQPRFSLPGLVILSPPQFTATSHQMLVDEVNKAARTPPPAQLSGGVVRFGQVPFARGQSALTEVRFISNLRLEDDDRSATFVLVDENTFDGKKLQMSLGAVEYLFDRRAPRLPEWLRIGIGNLFRNARFAPDGVTLGPPPWASTAETIGILKDPYFPRIFFPMREVFETTGPARDDLSPEAQRWRAQAALFTRWALGRTADDRVKFWDFAERAANDGMTEALLRETFKLGYPDLRDTLSDYLVTVLKPGELVIPDPAERPPPIAIRQATPVEVVRLRGEWERLEVNYVKARHPEFIESYQRIAQKTFVDAYPLGSQDGGFLANYALFFGENGEEAASALVLEEAVRFPGARAGALLVATRLRLKAAIAKPEGANGRLSVAQVTQVLELVPRARAQQPPTKALYDLVAEAWLACDSPPPAEARALISEGVRLFPRRD